MSEAKRNELARAYVEKVYGPPRVSFGFQRDEAAESFRAGYDQGAQSTWDFLHRLLEDGHLSIRASPHLLEKLNGLRNE